MTALELITASRALLDESTAALFSDAEVLIWINAGERDIAYKTGCLESISSLTTTASVRYVAFTGIKVNAVELVESGSTTTLVSGDVNWEDTSDTVWKDTSDVVWKDYERRVTIPYAPQSTLRITPHHFGHIPLRGQTKPMYWVQWGNYVLIEPIPDAAYTLNAYLSIYPTDQMSSNSDVPQIPYEFHEAIVPFVAMMGKLKSQLYTEAALKYAEYTILLQELIDKHIRRIPARTTDIRVPDEVRTK